MMKKSHDSDLEKMRSEICEKYKSSYSRVLSDLKLGIALNSLGEKPIYGVRLRPEVDTNGWYIWGGEYSKAPDFFQPVHTLHLEETLPFVLKYLALDPGFKFIVDEDGYEDVWYDPDLLEN